MHPMAYDMRCDKCWDGDLSSKAGRNIDWSEYEHCIWCYDCKIDTSGFGGLFDGPIAMGLTKMLGIVFWRIYLESKRIMKDVISGERIVYRQCSAKEIKWLNQPIEKRLDKELSKSIKLVKA